MKRKRRCFILEKEIQDKMITMKSKREKICLICIMLFAVGTRLVGLKYLPEGTLPDEAYGAYNAWGLLTEGIDSRGYAYPVYFVAWGSGMNVLYSYLAMPFLWLFGAETAVYRLPQALVGIASVYALYVLGRELFDQKFALFLAFVLALNPWHIMISRYGLESNLAPGMFLIGLCFLVLGCKKRSSYLILAAVFLGATLYCYAITWLLIPLFLLLFLLLYRKWISGKLYAVLAVGLLFLLALPLLVFLAVNFGLIGEIRTAYFSIPRLTGMRNGELSGFHIWEGFSDLTRILLSQYDGVSSTASRLVGAYYLFTTPFFVLGVVWHGISLVKDYKRGKNDLQYVFLIWFLSAVAVSVLNENITMIHINMIHIPVIFYGAYGIWKTADKLRSVRLLPACIAFFGLSFLLFIQDYVTYEEPRFFGQKSREALERAKELAGEDTITILEYATYKYSNLLWDEKPNIRDYCENVVYNGDTHFAEMLSYGQYRYIADIGQVEGSGVYLFQPSYEEAFRDMGFWVEKVNDNYFVAIKSAASEALP